MKLETAPQNVAVCGKFETSDFEIGDVAFIVDMFADKVYTRKERAVIRELSCNAYDSHVMAGTQHIPFKIHLPTVLEPFFSVRDYGLGLSDHDIRTVFAGIGISTKRNNNNTIGCFGIGSLSPYSLTDSFNVKSYHNGVVRTYVCYRDDQRKPVVSLLTEDQTDEQNGLEVSLSVNGKVKEFLDEAVNVFRFWQGVLPEINDESVVGTLKDEQENYLVRGKDFGISSSYGSMFAVMGNIAYKIPHELDEFNCDGYLEFELGELEFDTSRENLSKTDKVKNALRNKFKQVSGDIVKLIVKQIESCPTEFKRAKKAYTLQSLLGRISGSQDVAYKYHVPSTTENMLVFSYQYRSISRTETRKLPMQGNVEYYRAAPKMQSRIKNYVKENKRVVVILTNEQISECKIDDDVLRDLGSLPKVQRVKSSNSKSTPTSIIETYLLKLNDNYRYRDYNWLPISVDTTKELLYLEINRWEVVNANYEVSGHMTNLKQSIKTLEKVGISMPPIHGLKSSYLKSKEFKSGNWTHVDDYIKRELSKVKPESVFVYDNDEFDTMSSLSAVVDSQELSEWRQYAKTISEREDIAKLAGKLGIEVKEDNTMQNWIYQYLNRYPMLNLLKNHDFSRINSKVIAQYVSGVAL